MDIKCKNVEQTYELAGKLAHLLKRGDIVLLNGDLGAGKTTFVKGIAKALGVLQTVTSPTFTLLKTYNSNKYRIVHIDAYRLEGGSFDEIYDYLTDENVLFIEWASCLESLDFVKDYLKITIKYVSKNQRIYQLNAVGKRFEDLLEEMK